MLDDIVDPRGEPYGARRRLALQDARAGRAEARGQEEHAYGFDLAGRKPMQSPRAAGTTRLRFADRQS